MSKSYRWFSDDGMDDMDYQNYLKMKKNSKKHRKEKQFDDEYDDEKQFKKKLNKPKHFKKNDYID